MYYANINDCDFCNGDGIACTLFVSGCRCRCKGCHNKELWDFNYGNEWTKEVEDYFIQCCNDPNVDHISLLGGDFIQQDTIATLPLLKRLEAECGKPIWCWTGLTLEEFNSEQLELLKYIDVLIDGRFVEELKNLSLKYCGSSNQRVLDCKKTLKQNEIILYKGE